MSATDNSKFELRFTETNSAEDSTGKTWGLEGNLFWFGTGGAFAAVITLLFLFSVWRWSLLSALVPALIPVGLALLYALALRQGKASGYDTDLFELWLKDFTPSEYPTHRMLQELIQLDASDPAAADLATRLQPWCAGGNYGCLLDDASNISLTGKIAHFELGYIPEAAKLLRAVAGFLITNYTRQRIITMPRRLRKRNVYEEVARLLDIPGGEQIVKESYAQMRKFNLLEYFHCSAVQRIQRKPHSLRCIRQLAPIFSDAPERSRRSGRYGPRHRPNRVNEARHSFVSATRPTERREICRIYLLTFGRAKSDLRHRTQRRFARNALHQREQRHAV
jgi:hypothetical protein